MLDLISAYEIINAAPVKRDYPTSNICVMKDNIVMDIFRTCFSLEFLQELVDNKRSTAGALNYVSGTAYDQNDLVLFDGIIYKSLADANNYPLTDESKWIRQPKFEKTCYNDLWDSFMIKFLAFRIVYASVEYNSFQAGAKGITQFERDDTGITSAGSKGLASFKSSLWDDSVTIYGNMKRWIYDNPSCFEGVTVYGLNCGDSCKIRKRRRIAFKY